MVEIHVACSELVNMDTFSLSDPMVVLELKEGDRWVEFGRTEMVKDSLNPRFVRSFKVEFRFEEVQYLRFKCYDVDDLDKSLDRQDFIGEMICALSQVVTAPGQRMVRDLALPSAPHRRRGLIAVSAEEVQELNMIATIKMRGDRLDKKDLFGKSDPFIIISRVSEEGAFTPVAKTEVVRKNLSPQWKQFDISLQQLCNGDIHRPLKFEVFDWNRSGKHEFIGEFKTSVHALDDNGLSKRHVLINAKLKAKKKSYVNSGAIIFDVYHTTKVYSFLDYIRGGCEVNLITAIDFTASNGNPQYPNSLHFNGSRTTPNEYAAAIQAVGEVLTPYDDDQLFPVFGFGAKVPPNNRVSHCFPLNGNEDDPEVHGLNGILDVYRQSLSRVTLYGPTIFAQVLRKAFQMAGPHCTQDNQVYQIFLLLTDGVLDDLEASIDAIVKDNDMPISIIIVGVGKADFTKMDILDADDTPMKSSWGELARRDIVQFVPFSDFKGKSSSELAKAVLEEVPGQLLSYFKSRKIKPNPPRPDAPVGAPPQQPPVFQPPQQQQNNQRQDNIYTASYSAGPAGMYGNYLDVASQFRAPPAYGNGSVSSLPPQSYVPGQTPPQREGSSASSPYSAAPPPAYFVPPPAQYNSNSNN